MPNKPANGAGEAPSGLVVRETRTGLELRSEADARAAMDAERLKEGFSRREQVRIVEQEQRIGELERLFRTLCKLFEVGEDDIQALIQAASRAARDGAADHVDGLWVRWVHPIGEALSMPRLPRLGDTGAVLEAIRDLQDTARTAARSDDLTGQQVDLLVRAADSARQAAETIERLTGGSE